MEIYKLNLDELQILVALAAGKASDWLFGSITDAYVLEDGTILFDYTTSKAYRKSDIAGIAVTNSETELVNILKKIARAKWEQSQAAII